MPEIQEESEANGKSPATKAVSLASELDHSVNNRTFDLSIENQDTLSLKGLFRYQ